MQSGRENAGETGNQSTNAPTVALCGVRPDSPVSTDPAEAPDHFGGVDPDAPDLPEPPPF